MNPINAILETQILFENSDSELLNEKRKLLASIKPTKAAYSIGKLNAT